MNESVKPTGPGRRRPLRLTDALRERRVSGGLRDRIKLLLIGQRLNDGYLLKIAVYITLTSLAVLYISPLLYMLSTSFKNMSDMLDPAIRWIPMSFELQNYVDAAIGLDYARALAHTSFMAITAALLQVASCALTGYAFARLAIPFRNVLFAIVLVTFLVPVQTMAIPLFVLYSKLGWLNSPLPFLIPALFAQGIRGALFIIIFRQFFAALPKELEESAHIDGSGPLRMYWKIMFPLARPAMLVVFLFSLVWHWNSYFEPSLYLKNNSFLAMATQLDYLQANLNFKAGGGTAVAGQFDVNEPIKMAASLLVIMPLLVVYMFAQKYFVQGIERTGLVE
ncbi:carbohydrate ABC transporter permease [Paenibacillus senegalensis]|uniref:carbohydrate ABC transporter permease n=1 Tax=Paenibacillus senegalensis TaxID=1465766 RepID=UPI000287F78B|nr:carbohydrate ABC transporter permease [Paenibacillus senegalensis]